MNLNKAIALMRTAQVKIEQAEILVFNSELSEDDINELVVYCQNNKYHIGLTAVKLKKLVLGKDGDAELIE